MNPALPKSSNNMHKPFLITAAWLGCLSVALGAFGAHTLKAHLTQEAMGIFETGVKYQFYHVFALALTGILYQSFPSSKLLLSGKLFIGGIVLFSGSLYVLAILGTEHFSWIGAITPIGGILFIAGWFLLARAVQTGKTA